MDKLQDIIVYYPKAHFWSRKHVKTKYTVDQAGIPHGTCSTYDYHNPKIAKRQTEFKHGKKLQTSFFYPTGQVESTIDYVKDTIRCFDPQGNLRFRQSKGKAVCFDSHGKKQSL